MDQTRFRIQRAAFRFQDNSFPIPFLLLTMQQFLSWLIEIKLGPLPWDLLRTFLEGSVGLGSMTEPIMGRWESFRREKIPFVQILLF